MDIMLELPSDRPLSGTDGPHLPYLFVWDEVIALNSNVLRPFGGFSKTAKKKKKKSVQLSLVQSTKVCGMCFCNFEQ